jgi:hypothetical protein
VTRARTALVASLLVLAACGFVAERRLRGQWRSEATPERTLDLFADGAYSLRLSGKGLGFMSEILGPQKGTWRVQGGALVLVRSEAGRESSDRLQIDELSADQVVLAGERWRRTR